MLQESNSGIWQRDNDSYIKVSTVVEKNVKYEAP